MTFTRLNLSKAAFIGLAVFLAFGTYAHVLARELPQVKPLVVVLDPGHGGSDIGAANGTEVEKILTLQVAQRVASILRSNGYRVYLTRTKDQGVNTPERDLNHDHHIDHADEYDARTLFANRHHANVFVSIHFDANGDPSLHGTHGYYCPARPFWRKSARLANLVTRSISVSVQRAGYLSPNNGVQTDVADVVAQMRADYPWFLVLGPSRPRFLTGTAMPGALIETLYLSSPRDEAALHKRTVMSAIVHGYANGIREYLRR